MFKKAIITFMALFLFNAANSAAMPVIYNVIMDATRSVSEENFSKANRQISQFAELLYERSQVNVGQLADWLTVNYFGGDEQYDGTIFINCSDKDRLETLQQMVRTKDHPRYGSTAIYHAIALGTAEVIQKQQEFAGNYMRNIILITDGEDNDSPRRIEQAIKETYPNEAINLFVIGVGENSNLSEFNRLADMVIPVDNFDALGGAIVLTSQLVN